MGKDSQGKTSECFVKVNWFDCERDGCKVLLSPLLKTSIINRLSFIYLFVHLNGIPVLQKNYNTICTGRKNRTK